MFFSVVFCYASTFYFWGFKTLYLCRCTVGLSFDQMLLMCNNDWLCFENFLKCTQCLCPLYNVWKTVCHLVINWLIIIEFKVQLWCDLWNKTQKWVNLISLCSDIVQSSFISYMWGQYNIDFDNKYPSRHIWWPCLMGQKTNRSPHQLLPLQVAHK